MLISVIRLKKTYMVYKNKLNYKINVKLTELSKQPTSNHTFPAVVT